MRRTIAFFVAFITAFTTAMSLFSCSDDTDTTQDNPDMKAGKIFYVSENGNDSNDGSENSPLATALGARDAIRKYKAENGLPDGGIEVIFKAGTYKMTSSVEFISEDSGEEGKPIVYRADDGAEVIFDGGITLNASDFVPANEQMKARIIDPAAKEALLEIDLEKAGCYNLVDRRDYGKNWDSYDYRQELYVDNKRQQLAKWPNEGSYLTGGGETDSENKITYLYIPEEKCELWSNLTGYRYYGAPEADWDMAFRYDKKLSIDKGKCALAISGWNKTPTQSSTLWIYNIPEEIDMPGEYYWDVEANKLYYYPDGDISGKKISFSQFDGSFFKFTGVKFVQMQGFTVENTRATVFYGEYSGNSDLLFDNITARCIGTNVLNIWSDNTTVSNCEMYEIGATGIDLSGGGGYEVSEKNVLASGNVVYNNLIHDFAQTYKIDNPAIRIRGCGGIATHNEIYNSPHIGILINSGYCIIEYNKVYDVCKETSDAGAICAPGRWDYRDVIVRYNYVANVKDLYHGGTPTGLYFDDMASHITAYGNILVDIAGVGITVGGGKFNAIENNLIIRCGATPITTDGRGRGFAAKHVAYPEGRSWQQLLQTGIYDDINRFATPTNLLRTEISTLSSMYRIDDPGIMSYTTIRGNVAYGCTADCLWEDRNYGDIYKDAITVDGVVNLDPMARLYCTIEGNCHYDEGEDIGLLESGALSENSRIFRDIPGFEMISFEKIGLVLN